MKGRGFTLIELLVVISIIALLSSVVIASLTSARDKAKIARARADMAQISRALSLYMADNNGTGPKELPLPTSGTNIDTKWHAPDCTTVRDTGYTGDDWPNQQNVSYFATELGKYMTIPTDPWGTPYWVDSAYSCNGGGTGCEGTNNWVFALVSSGPNKNPNGAGPVYEADNVVLILCTHP